MRITPSSSLFLATLAISSSSSSLAAPTEPGSLDMSALSSSSSIRSMVMMGRDESFDVKMGQAPPGSLPATDTRMSLQRRQLESLLPILEGLPVVGGILAPLIQKVLGILGLEQKGAAAVESVVDPSQLDALVEALSEATSKIKNAKNSVTGGAPPSGNKRALAMAYGEAMEYSTAPSNASFTSQYTMSSTATSSSQSATSVEAMGLPTPGVAHNLPIAPPTGNNGTAPLSPPIPINPPNTPVAPPSGNVRPPLPVGASPPSGPIPRDAPPMFPAFRAADVSSMAPAASASCTFASTGDPSCANSTASGSSGAVSESATPSSDTLSGSATSSTAATPGSTTASTSATSV
ncbi:hypothetical protein OH77DRAFT_473241 [Trametes cingulata]|nr:hypothetical protein OH77DRAFT_473241 [Trametes cingulata]